MMFYGKHDIWSVQIKWKWENFVNDKGQILPEDRYLATGKYPKSAKNLKIFIADISFPLTSNRRASAI